MSFLPSEIIKKKKAGHEHSFEELQFFINEFVTGKIPQYQMSAWLMAVCIKGMSHQETSWLTEIMLKSGHQMDFSSLSPLCVDKHSTGGVGDKTSIVLAPIVAACGVPVSMISGRGLGHTGGTLDKLESITGFSTQLNLNEFENMVRDIQLSMIGQTKEICPADKKIYALRDVTGTVESLPLICASIMSKKIAEGIGALALDVKFGSGAFMKNFKEAKELAEQLIFIGKDHGLKITASLTNMTQPLGKFIGNALEIKECLDILENKSAMEKGFDFYQDTKDLSLHLATQMIFLSGHTDTLDKAAELAFESLESGQALEKFKQMASLQGAPDVYHLPQATNQHKVFAQSSGYLSSLNTEKIGVSSIKLGAGRFMADDTLDPTAGIEMHIKKGQKINKGDLIFTLYSTKVSNFDEVGQYLINALEFSEEKIHKEDLIKEIIYGGSYGQ